MKLFKWITVFISMLFVTALLIGGFNYIIDPFGVFGDKMLKWDSYNMVNNPRVSKIAYLDENHEKYDSYIIGGSKSSSISPQLLNEYYGDANFYSMMMYGGDFYDYEKTLNYIVDHYQPKNIVVHMSLHEIGHFNENANEFKQSLHAKVLNEPLLPFYSKYLLLNPTYSFNKLEGYGKHQVDPEEYAQIIPETGVYNKKKRDAENTDNLEQFIEDNPGFSDAASQFESVAMDKNVASLKRMKEYAEANGVHFTFMSGATNIVELKGYNLEDLKTYWKKLADVTDFWDFSGYTAVTENPRYFYDAMHYRNNVGQMMLGYMFKDPKVYIPKDFGHLTTAENVEAHAEKVFKLPVAATGEEARVPILIYHHIDEDPDPDNPLIITPDKLKQDMLDIKEAGYETVHLKDLVNYVNGEGTLPEKPIVVTFDDGYLSNYEYAYPILRELDMKATISIVGWSEGRDTNRIKNAKFYPHFSYVQAKEMYDSGLIDIQNHSYDMHEFGPSKRSGVLQEDTEFTGVYSGKLIEDAKRLKAEIEENVGNEVFAFSYPLGLYSLLSEQILADQNYQVTLSTVEGVNILKKDEPSSLFAMKRINTGVNNRSTQFLELLK